MPVSIGWDNPQQRVIRVCFKSKWDADDLQGMILQGRSMIASVKHPVDCIFDFSHSVSSPTTALAILQNLDFEHHENERLIIIVKANSYIKTMCNIARKLSPRTFANLLFVDSINEAYNAIATPFALVR